MPDRCVGHESADRAHCVCSYGQRQSICTAHTARDATVAFAQVAGAQRGSVLSAAHCHHLGCLGCVDAALQVSTSRALRRSLSWCVPISSARQGGELSWTHPMTRASCTSEAHERHSGCVSSLYSSALCYCRASSASLPLLGQAIGTLPLGSWSSESLLVQRESNGMTEVGTTALQSVSLVSASALN